MPTSTRMFRIRTAATMILFVAIAAAILIQDHSAFLPLALFNEYSGQYARLSNACLFATIGILAALAVEMVQGKPRRSGAVIRSGVVVLIATELLLGLGDRLFVSRNPKSSIGGPYYERQAAGGSWVFLRKPHGASALGFRTQRADRRMPDGRRILFLVDSYTEGSGSSAECNYPDVVEKVLREQHGPVEVM